MKNKKVDDISYCDLKEACKIFNRHEHLLGARIKVSRIGFNDLRESFIKAVTDVPLNRRNDIPEEVIAFYKALPGVCFDTANVVAQTPAEKAACTSKDIPEFRRTVCGTQKGSAAGDEANFLRLTRREEGNLKHPPSRGGKVKVKATCTLPDAIRHLEDLVGGLKYGQIFIASRYQEVMMKPDDLLNMKLAAGLHKEGKNQEERLTVELKWMRSMVTSWNEDGFSISCRRTANV
jgi:hypothetical protein